MTEIVLHSQLNSTVKPARYVVWLATAVVALPWFWPIIAGPLSAMLPDLVAWCAGALLVSLWYPVRDYFDEVIAWGLLIAAVGSALIGLLQYFDIENSIGVWVVLTKPGEVTANIQQTNLLATLLSAGLLCIFYLLSNKRLSNFQASWMSVALVVTLAATASRTGMVHLILISIIVWFTWSGRKTRVLAILLGIAGLYLVATQALPWLFKMLWGASLDRNLLTRLSTDYACASRKVLWANVAHLISLKPWTGWGPGELMYAHYITPYEGDRFCMKLSNAHNLPIHLAFVWGIPFALIAVVTSIWGLWKLKPWGAKSRQEQFGWAILALVGFHSLVEFPLWFGLFQVLAAMAIVMVVNGRRTSRVQGAQLSSKPAIRFQTLLVASLTSLAALAFVAADYFKVSQLYLPVQWRPAYYQVDTLERVRNTVLFKSHVLIAQVVSTTVTQENAPLMLLASLEALHIAPDSRIIRQVIAAARVMGRSELAALHEERYKAAWPELYGEWLVEQSLSK